MTRLLKALIWIPIKLCELVVALTIAIVLIVRRARERRAQRKEG
jgi:hypothetical protein